MTENEMREMDDRVVQKIAQATEKRLVSTLKVHLESIIKPYQKDRLKILEEEFEKAQHLFAEIESTLLGTFVIQRAVKRINKKESISKEIKDKKNE
jgi:uncharacterized membrane protein YgaE (UPF0421/DUF939 family)